MRRVIGAIAVAILSLTTARAVAADGPVTLARPPYVQVFFRTPGPQNEVAGNLVRYDAESLWVKTVNDEKQLKWADLTPTSAYNARAGTIDKTKAADWLALGKFAWQMGAQNQGRIALATAARMDPTLRPQVEAILAAPPPPPASRPAARPGNSSSAAAREKYQKATPQEHAQAIQEIRKEAAELAKSLQVDWHELETTHFLIYTDWDLQEDDFLRQNVEGAYAAVTGQFEIPVKENIFIGKLPVFMFNHHGDFGKFAFQVDQIHPAADLDGYYAGRSDGFGHMAMWKPRSGDGVTLDQAKLLWAHVLVHEFTHAFVARYHGNAHIPTWLNEGIAETISSRLFPLPGALLEARAAAIPNRSRFYRENIQDIFAGDLPKRAEDYPIMWTLTQTLVARDHNAFMAMFDAIKDGTPPDQALQKYYNWDYRTLEAAWRQYMKKN